MDKLPQRKMLSNMLSGQHNDRSAPCRQTALFSYFFSRRCDYFRYRGLSCRFALGAPGRLSEAFGRMCCRSLQSL